MQHFVRQGIIQSTVYRWLDKLNTNCPIKDKQRTGRKSNWTPVTKQRHRQAAIRQFGISLRKLSAKFGKNHQTIKNKLNSMGIKYRRRQKAPKKQNNLTLK